MFPVAASALGLYLIVLAGGDVGQAAQGQAPTVEPIRWSATRKLVWTDFRGKATSQMLGAQSALGYAMSLGCRDGVLQVSIVAEFLPDQSWVADRILLSGLASPIGLRHEQLHFDLKEVYARKLRKMFAELPSPCPRTDDALYELTVPLRREELEMQDRIERATLSGELEARQMEWERRVAADLKTLAAFAVAHPASGRLDV
jgi:hypothetical protein